MDLEEDLEEDLAIRSERYLGCGEYWSHTLFSIDSCDEIQIIYHLQQTGSEPLEKANIYENSHRSKLKIILLTVWLRSYTVVCEVLLQTDIFKTIFVWDLLKHNRFGVGWESSCGVIMLGLHF